MKLSDIIDDKIEVEKAEEASEKIKSLMRDGLDFYEQAFGSKFVEIVTERSKGAGVKCDPKVLRDYSLGEECDKFLKKRLRSEKNAREDYYEAYPDCRPKSDEDKTQMPPLEMVPSLINISGLKLLFEGLSDLERNEISDMFGIKSEEMIEIFPHLQEIRNKCSHNQGQSRIPELAFCLRKFAGPSDVTIINKGKIESLDLNNSLFGSITLLRHMLSKVPYSNIYHMAREWKPKLIHQLSMMPQKVLVEMGFPSGWMDLPTWQRSKRKTIKRIGVTHSSNFQILVDIYERMDADQKKEVDRRTKLISKKLVEEGWDTANSRMDNYKWTARACVMRSVLGFEDQGHGFPEHELERANAMANGSEDDDDLLNALNDFYAEKIFNDSVWTYIPKGASDETILKKIDRWMRFDQKRRESGFHESLLMSGDFVRIGGPAVILKDIFPSFSAPFFLDIMDEKVHEFEGEVENFLSFLHNREDDYLDQIPEWIRSKTKSIESVHKLFNVCRNALMTKIGENGIIHVTYSNLTLWPEEICIDLDRVNPAFKVEVEDGYKFRDPMSVGRRPYDAPFHYPFMLEKDVAEILREPMPTENPFSSVDNIISFLHRYYREVIKRKYYSKIKSVKNGDLNIELICRTLTRKDSKNFKAMFHIKVNIGNIYKYEWDSDIPIDIEDMNGELHVKMNKIKLHCRRDADSLMKKITRKIKQKGKRI